MRIDKQPEICKGCGASFKDQNGFGCYMGAQGYASRNNRCRFRRVVLPDMALQGKYERHAEYCRLLNETYRKKNHDYGDSFATVRDKLPETVLVHLNEKLLRLETLMRGEAAQARTNLYCGPHHAQTMRRSAEKLRTIHGMDFRQRQNSGQPRQLRMQ